MILEVARSLTDWFNDPVTGIAQRLATTVPRDVGDALPTVGPIADQTRNNNVAQNRFPAIPGVAVNVRQMPMLDGNAQIVSCDGDADVLVRIIRSSKDTKDIVRDSSYILRAIIQSWRAFNHDTRSRNQIQIYACTDLAIAPGWEAIDDGIITGAAAGTLRFRDISP